MQKKKAAPATPAAAPAAVEQKDDNRRGGNRGARRGGRGSDRPRGPPRTVCYILLCWYLSDLLFSKTVKTPKVLHNEKEVTDQEVADVDAAEEDDVMVTESLIENLVIQRAHTRYLHSYKASEMRISILSILLSIPFLLGIW